MLSNHMQLYGMILRNFTLYYVIVLYALMKKMVNEKRQSLSAY